MTHVCHVCHARFEHIFKNRRFVVFPAPETSPGSWKPMLDTITIGWWFGTCFFFSCLYHILGMIIPADFQVFFRGIQTTNQTMVIWVTVILWGTCGLNQGKIASPRHWQIWHSGSHRERFRSQDQLFVVLLQILYKPVFIIYASSVIHTYMYICTVYIYTHTHTNHIGMT